MAGLLSDNEPSQRNAPNLSLLKGVTTHSDLFTKEKPKTRQRESLTQMPARPTISGKSFLDELLLGNDNDKNDTPRRKSVRFFNEDEGDRTFSHPDKSKEEKRNRLSQPQSDRKKTGDAFADWENSETRSMSADHTHGSSRSSSSMKADWLGIGNEDAEKSEMKFSEKTFKEKESDWISSGLKNRRSKTAIDKSETENPNTTDSVSWLGLKKKIENAKVRADDQEEGKGKEENEVDFETLPESQNSVPRTVFEISDEIKKASLHDSSQSLFLQTQVISNFQKYLFYCLPSFYR